MEVHGIRNSMSYAAFALDQSTYRHIHWLDLYSMLFRGETRQSSSQTCFFFTLTSYAWNVLKFDNHLTRTWMNFGIFTRSWIKNRSQTMIRLLYIKWKKVKYTAYFKETMTNDHWVSAENRRTQKGAETQSRARSVLCQLVPQKIEITVQTSWNLAAALAVYSFLKAISLPCFMPHGSPREVKSVSYAILEACILHTQKIINVKACKLFFVFGEKKNPYRQYCAFEYYIITPSCEWIKKIKKGKRLLGLYLFTITGVFTGFTLFMAYDIGRALLQPGCICRPGVSKAKVRNSEHAVTTKMNKSSPLSGNKSRSVLQRCPQATRTAICFLKKKQKKTHSLWTEKVLHHPVLALSDPQSGPPVALHFHHVFVSAKLV